MHQRRTSLLGAMILATSTFASVSSASPGRSEKKVQNDGFIVAQSKVSDAGARQIVRSVSSESLKTISTKDSTSTLAEENPAKENEAIAGLEETGPVVRPAKIESHPAPGTTAVLEAPTETSETAAAPVSTTTPVSTMAPVARRAPAAKTEAKSEPAHAVGVTADKALTWLENGNKRFVKNNNRSDGKAQTDRARLAKSQKPHAIVLSCADSRVPPETVFDQSLGEIFVVRTAGEALDASVIASIEYAVEHLGPQLLVVMGHTSCGAVSATLSTNEGASAGSASLDALIADIRPRLPSRGPAGVASQGLEIESAANAQGVAADLMKRSTIIRSHVEKGDLTIKPALYHLDSGIVKFY